MGMEFQILAIISVILILCGLLGARPHGDNAPELSAVQMWRRESKATISLNRQASAWVAEIFGISRLLSQAPIGDGAAAHGSVYKATASQKAMAEG